MSRWDQSYWTSPGGLVVPTVPMVLAGTTPTEDANTIITSDFSTPSAGRILVSISTGASQYDGLSECAIKRMSLANVATLLGKTTTQLTDGSHVLMVFLTPLAEIPRYGFLGVGWSDDAVQASITGGVVSVWRNAASDNLQPNIHDGSLDVVPPGGAVARSNTGARVIGALKYDGTHATAFSCVGFTVDHDHMHGAVAYEPTISKTPTHLVLAVGSNNGSGVTGTLDVRVELAAVPAAQWPLMLG